MPLGLTYQRPLHSRQELLRYEPPVHFLPNRDALDDIDIAGTTIQKGSPITLMLASGNRNPGRCAPIKYAV